MALENPGHSRDNDFVSNSMHVVMGGKQLELSHCYFTTAKNQAIREKFLAELEAVVPWQALLDLIEPLTALNAKLHHQSRG